MEDDKQQSVPAKPNVPGHLEERLNQMADAELWKLLMEVTRSLAPVVGGSIRLQPTESGCVLTKHETSVEYFLDTCIRITFEATKEKHRRQFITNWIAKVEKISVDVEDVTEVVRDLEEKIDR